MSQISRDQVGFGINNLESAEQFLNGAENRFKNAGDTTTAARISKIQAEVSVLREAAKMRLEKR